MKAYVIHSGRNPDCFSMSKDRALSYVRRCAERRVREENAREAARGRNWPLEIREITDAKEIPAPFLKIVIFQRIGASKGKTMLTEYRVYELESLESPLVALAEQSD